MPDMTSSPTNMPNAVPGVEITKPHSLCSQCKSFWKDATCLVFTAGELLRGGANVPSMPQHRLLAPHRSLVLASATSGCHFCSIVVGSVTGCTGEHADREFVDDQDGPLYVSIAVLDAGAGSFLLTIFPCEESKIISHDQILSEHSILLRLPRDRPDSLNKSSSELKLSRMQTTTFSNATADFIKAWITDCRSNHPLCADDFLAVLFGITDLHARPKRLLDLQAFQDPGKIRLVDVGDGSEFEYCALSYSWGFSTPYLMKSSNLVDFQNEILLGELPKLLQDSITVVRGLGYQYLWIDALCIMQDGDVSPAASIDWVDQAGKMNDIFGNASVTIAASECFDGKSSLIVPRNPLSQLTCQLKLGAGIQYEVVPFCTPHCLLHPFDKARYHLDSRAWVFQERILSPRTIHVTRNFVHLECKTELCCGAMDGPDACHHSGAFAKADYQVLFSLLGPNGLNEDFHGAFLSFWHELIRRFSTMNLSRKAYRLVALAGLARQVQSKSNLTWSFGMWRECLLQEMLWYVRGGKGTPCHERAPTWSWASIEVQGSQIMHEPGTHFTQLAHVTSLPDPTEFAKQPDTPIGEPKHCVKVTGRLRPGIPDQSACGLIGDKKSVEGELHIHRNCRGMPDIHTQCPFHPDTDLPDNVDKYSFLMACISGTQRLEGNHQAWKTHMGIILTPMEGFKSRYKRVGYFHIDRDHEIGADDEQLPWSFGKASVIEVEIV